MHTLYVALVVITAAVHTAFVFGEMHPWSKPRLLGYFADRPPTITKLDATQLPLVAAIVKNAGIYNAIVAGGLFWAAADGDINTARVLLLGAGVAGIFGAATLKTPIPLAQAVLGFGGFLVSLAVGAPPMP